MLICMIESKNHFKQTKASESLQQYSLQGLLMKVSYIMQSFLGGLAFGWERFVYRIPISTPPPEKKKVSKKHRVFHLWKVNLSFSAAVRPTAVFLPRDGVSGRRIMTKSQIPMESRPAKNQGSGLLQRMIRGFCWPIFGQEIFGKKIPPQKKTCVCVYMYIYAGNMFWIQFWRDSCIAWFISFWASCKIMYSIFSRMIIVHKNNHKIK